jgi:hypothetical protein
MREVERFDVEFDKFFYIWQPATGNSEGTDFEHRTRTRVTRDHNTAVSR